MAGCQSSSQTPEAVRQAVIDHLAGRPGLEISSMDVSVSSVSFKQNEADAMVLFVPKGAAPSQGMSMRYTLEQKGGKWVVKNREGSGENPHGEMSPPGGQMPQGHPPVGGPPQQ
jgi:hypothetical protein